MVFFLLRREDSLKMALWFALLAPLALLIPQGERIMTFAFLGFLGQVVLMSALRLRLNRRTTYFEIALPICGREIFAVRVIGVLSAIWLPVAVASTLLFVSGRGAATPVFQGAAILTLAVLLPLTVRPREASVSIWFAVGSWIGAIAIGAATWSLFSPLLHLTFFAAGSGALVVRAYLSVPDTFELSPRAVSENRPVAERRLFRRPAWWAIFRSALPWLGIVSFVWGFLGFGSILLALQFSFLVFQAGAFTRNHTRWLLMLPLSHRALLWITMATTVVPLLAGIAISTWVAGRPSFRSRGRAWRNS